MFFDPVHLDHGFHHSLHGHDGFHKPEQGTMDKLQAKLSKAIHKDLVFIEGIGHVPGSVDGMTAFLKAKHVFSKTGAWEGKLGPEAHKQYIKDELKMFKGVDDTQAGHIVEQLGL